MVTGVGGDIYSWGEKNCSCVGFCDFSSSKWMCKSTSERAQRKLFRARSFFVDVMKLSMLLFKNFAKSPILFSKCVSLRRFGMENVYCFAAQNFFSKSKLWTKRLKMRSNERRLEPNLVSKQSSVRLIASFLCFTVAALTSDWWRTWTFNWLGKLPNMNK